MAYPVLTFLSIIEAVYELASLCDKTYRNIVRDRNKTFKEIASLAESLDSKLRETVKVEYYNFKLTQEPFKVKDLKVSVAQSNLITWPELLKLLNGEGPDAVFGGANDLYKLLRVLNPNIAPIELYKIGAFSEETIAELTGLVLPDLKKKLASYESERQKELEEHWFAKDIHESKISDEVHKDYLIKFIES